MKKNTIYSKDFILVVIGQIISIFGNQILRYAIPLYLLNQTGSSGLFGTISAIYFIPMLVLYPIGGIFADRLNKKNIMVMLDFFTSGLVFIFCILQGRMNIIPLIGGTMIILYAIQGIYEPAVKASIPILVKGEDLIKANSIVDVVNSLASMIGPVIGGILFSIFGLGPVLYISIACFFISAVMEIFICIPFERKKSGRGLLETGVNDMKLSFNFIFNDQPIIWKVSAIYSLANLFLTSLILIAGPVIITQKLGFSLAEGNRLYGYAQGAIATGAVLGGLLSGFLSNRLNPSKSPLILIGSALSIIVVGLGLQVLKNPMQVYFVMVAGFSLLISLSTLFQIQLMTYIQRLTPNDLIGKVIACVICICRMTSPVGQFVYGLVYENVGNYYYLPFYLMGLFTIVIALLTRKVFQKVEELVG